MADVFVAFLWHHHQPDYRDPATGEAILPWTRLHGVKDYYSMAKIASEFPEVKQNFNLVPAMLEQLSQIADGGSDLYLRLSLKPAAELDDHEKRFILKEFFSASFKTMIAPFPGYENLFNLYSAKGRESPDKTAKLLSEQEFRDLQVFFNMAWFHPYSREKEPFLTEIANRGKGFSEEDKNALLDLQVNLLREVIPLYRSLSEDGIAELTTTPYYHPIMPLLCNVRDALEAMPGAPLPTEFSEAPEDARAHMEKSVAFHEKLFGSKPRGCWPSEGSVSVPVLDILSKAGIEWCATDEEILSATLSRSGRDVRLDGHDRADLLYQAYEADTGNSRIKVIFRDHYLSDLIGFTYHTYEPKAAAANLVGHLHRIADKAADRKGSWIVPIILDGENAWEYYKGGGLIFLRELFGLLSVSKKVKTTKITDFIRNSETKSLQGIFPGSWISHNFKIWIGEPLNNRGWDYLGKTRRALVDARDDLSPEKRISAWESIYRAEGSDWFWWFSEQHSSAHDEQFDAIFRSHLRNVYRVIGDEIPGFVEEPVVTQAKSVYTQPYALLDVRIDGRRSDYFEWLCAGSYEPARDQGAMARQSGSVISALYFGFDMRNFYLRIDISKKVLEMKDSSIKITFAEPVETELIAEIFSKKAFRIQGSKDMVGEIATDRFVEASVPFDVLGIGSGQKARFQIEFASEDGTVEKLPFSGQIEFISPTEEFEMIQWQA